METPTTSPQQCQCLRIYLHNNTGAHYHYSGHSLRLPMEGVCLQHHAENSPQNWNCKCPQGTAVEISAAGPLQPTREELLRGGRICGPPYVSLCSVSQETKHLTMCMNMCMCICMCTCVCICLCMCICSSQPICSPHTVHTSCSTLFSVLVLRRE